MSVEKAGMLFLLICTVFFTYSLEDCCSNPSLLDKYTSCCGEKCCPKTACCGEDNAECCKPQQVCCQGSVCCSRQNCCGKQCCSEDELCINEYLYPSMLKSSEEEEENKSLSLRCCPESKVCESNQRGEEYVSCCGNNEVCCNGRCCEEGHCSEEYGFCCGFEKSNSSTPHSRILCGNAERCCSESEQCCLIQYSSDSSDRCCPKGTECCSETECCDSKSSVCTDFISNSGKYERKCLERNIEDLLNSISEESPVAFEILFMPLGEGEGTILKSRTNSVVNSILLSDMSKKSGANWKPKSMQEFLAFYFSLNMDRTAEQIKEYLSEPDTKKGKLDENKVDYDLTVFLSTIQSIENYNYLPKIFLQDPNHEISKKIKKIILSGNILEQKSGNLESVLLSSYMSLTEEINNGNPILFDPSEAHEIFRTENVLVESFGANLGEKKSTITKTSQLPNQKYLKTENELFSSISMSQLSFSSVEYDDICESLEHGKYSVLVPPKFGEFEYGSPFTDSVQSFFGKVRPKNVVFSGGQPRCEWIPIFAQLEGISKFSPTSLLCSNVYEEVEMPRLHYKVFQTLGIGDGAKRRSSNFVLVRVHKDGRYSIDLIDVPKSMFLSRRNQKKFDAWFKRDVEKKRRKKREENQHQDEL